MDSLEARGSFPTLSISMLRTGDVWQGIARYDAWMAKNYQSRIDTLLENYTFMEGIIQQLAAEEDQSRAHIFN